MIVIAVPGPPVTLGDLVRDDKLLWSNAATAATNATWTRAPCRCRPPHRCPMSAST